ncbi:tetratricopeptide repeat protein [Christiangramia sabulilitoris]|uniref:Tetratricopeptide repeat protein n=1 Tax=Christiangramia sabulilitoris TaxID=2583991 RepID=A0A550I929_9FLAO|nr:tetratricopeptide repeat protein [Christiangramia sabulilitoris]TRO67338.1 tetratricopeptide repeat protein [Christiangramia sabulilitoris]
MRNLIIILMVVFTVLPAKSQELPQLFLDVNQDDLGNVSDEFQEYFFEALKQKGIENYEKAITALEKCLELNTEKAVVYFELGRNYRELENFDLAIANLEKAQELAPENETILVYLFQTYGMTEAYDSAIATVKKLIPLDDAYREDLANLYFLNKDYDLALQLLDELDDDLGTSSYRTSLRRQVYARTNNTGAQIDNLQESIIANPDVEQNYLNLIYIYSEQGEEEEAFRVALELLETNPGSSLAHLALYKFYLNKNDPEAAVASMKIVFESEEIDVESKFKVLNDFLNFVQNNPEYEEELIEVAGKLTEWEDAPKLYEQLGKYYLNKDNRADALKFFELGLKENPGNFDLLRNTLLLQLEFKKFEAARDLSEEALESFPSQPMLYLLQAVALNSLGDFEAAEESLNYGLDYLIEDKRMEFDYYSQLAISYNGMNNAVKAEEFRRKAENLKKEIN